MTYLPRKLNFAKCVIESNKRVAIRKFTLSFAFDGGVSFTALNRHVKVRKRIMNAIRDVWC